MSVISFPLNPTLYQSYTVGSKVWIWNGYAWDLQLANTAPILSLAQAAYTQANTGVTNAATALGVAQGAYNTANTKLSSTGGTVSGSVTVTQDLTVTGNVYISGNTVTLTANNLVIDDSLIYLANNNPTNVNDIGIVGHFTASPTGYQHTGLARDASDGVWKLFSNVVSEFSNNTIDFSDAVYDTLKVGTVLGNVYGNSNTATTLQNARLINGTNFDGSSNITILANTFNALTFGNGFNVGTFNGSGAVTLTANNSSTTLAGIVQLTDSVSSTSITTAATPNSVKTSYDQATNAFTQANTALGVGQSAFSKANSAITLGSTPLYLGSTNTAVSGLSSVTSTIFSGSLYGNSNTATNIVGGTANSILYQTTANTTSFITAPITANTYLNWSGSSFVWSAVSASGGGATITNDTTTNSSFYPVFTSITSGTMSTASVANTKMYFNPSTGTFNATVINTLSDVNFKENISEIVNGLDVIKQITAVEYDWKDSGRHSSGVIAQQLETVLPYLVETNEQEGKSVNYSGLVAFLIGAVKELSEKVEQLENR